MKIGIHFRNYDKLWMHDLTGLSSCVLCVYVCVLVFITKSLKSSLLQIDFHSSLFLVMQSKQEIATSGKTFFVVVKQPMVDCILAPNVPYCMLSAFFSIHPLIIVGSICSQWKRIFSYRSRVLKSHYLAFNTYSDGIFRWLTNCIEEKCDIIYIRSNRISMEHSSCIHQYETNSMISSHKSKFLLLFGIFYTQIIGHNLIG